MKCQKCHAENINEAVKCGMCGIRLKHYRTLNDFTRSQQVESSVRRDNPSKQPNKQVQHAQENNLSQVPRSVTEIIMDQNISLENKAKIVSDSWKNSASSKNTPDQSRKKNGKWLWVIAAIFIFAAPIIDVVMRVIIPEIQYQVREHLRIVRETDAETSQTAEAATAVISNVYQARYFEMLGYQERLAGYYQSKHAYATSLKDIEKFEKTQFSDFIFDEIEITKDGALVGKFKDSPTSKIYMMPVIERNEITNWDCYRINIDDDLMSECQLLESDPFV